jgi:ATP-binding cassette subfamily B (MDR/TAP) protein 1
MAADFGFGVSLVKSNSLSVINLYRIHISMSTMASTLLMYFLMFPSIKAATKAVMTCQKIISRLPKIDSMSEIGLKPTDIKGDIEFHDVHFRYPTRKAYIFRGLNLKAESNKMTALLGPSGCGKSTVIQILMRFYDVDRGLVTVDGININYLNVRWLRSQIGIVSQEPTLFNASILDNMKFGHLNPTDVT